MGFGFEVLFTVELYCTMKVQRFHENFVCRRRPSIAFSEAAPEIISLASQTVASCDDGNQGEPVILTIIENANVDGVRHLQANNPVTKFVFCEFSKKIRIVSERLYIL